jgi:cytochrome c553
MILRALIAVLLAGFVATPSVAAPAGAEKAWARCAACHLASGNGVPGAFPRLAGRIGEAAKSDKGRAYLVLTVSAGLIGPINVDGKTYRGVMPAQAGLTDADIAAVLNYAARLPGPGGETPPAAKLFTADEVASIKAAHAKVSANAVHAARAGVFTEGAAKPPVKQP